MADLSTLPIHTNADARATLGVVANQINRAYQAIATATNGLDYTQETSDLDITQASVNGLYAVVPNNSAVIEAGLSFKVSNALNSAQVALDDVALAVGMPGATWDFDGALDGLVHDTVATVTGAAKQVGQGAADTLAPLLKEIGWALAGLVLLIVILLRNGATLGGLL